MPTNTTRLLAIVALAVCVLCGAMPSRAADAQPAGASLDLGRFAGLPNAVLLDADVVGGGTPSDEVIAEAARQGVRTLIDLRRPDEGLEPQQAAAKRHGLAYVNIPVSAAALTAETIDAFAKALNEGGARPALVVCASGNRVGGVWALYLNLHKHVPAAEAVAQGERAGLRSEAMREAVRKLLRQ